MKTYITDIIPRIQSWSRKLEDITLLTNHHWVVLDELSKSKLKYIFRSGGQLIISQDGNAIEGEWEYLGHNSIYIKFSGKQFLYKNGFFDDTILVLILDGSNETSILINESKFNPEFSTIERVQSHLTSRYLVKNREEFLEKELERAKTRQSSIHPIGGSMGSNLGIILMIILFAAGVFGVIYLASL